MAAVNIGSFPTWRYFKLGGTDCSPPTPSIRLRRIRLRSLRDLRPSFFSLVGVKYNNCNYIVVIIQFLMLHFQKQIPVTYRLLLIITIIEKHLLYFTPTPTKEKKEGRRSRSDLNLIRRSRIEGVEGGTLVPPP